MTNTRSLLIGAAGMLLLVLVAAGGFLLGRSGDDATGDDASSADPTPSTTTPDVATTVVPSGDVTTTRAQALRSTSSTTPPASAAPAVQEFSDLFEALRGAVGRVDAVGCDAESQGTAFLVSPEIAYTAQHVVDDAAEIALRIGGERVEAEVLGADAALDVAVLRLARPIENAPILEIASESPRVGEEVAAMGHPRGLPLALTVGRVTSMNGSFDFGSGDALDNLIQTDAVVAPGSSGGPLIDRMGRVVGIVILKDLAAEGLMYAGDIQGSIGVLTDWRDAATVQRPAVCVGSLDLDTIESFAADTIGATVDHPELARLQLTFAAYTQAINSGRAEDGFALLGPAITTNNSAAAWAEGQATSSLWGWTIRSIDQPVAGTLDVRSTFMSTQEAAFGFDGESTCTRWDITHELVDGELDGRPFWFVNRSRATDGGGPVDCAGWEPSLAQEWVIDPIAEGDAFAGSSVLDPGTYDAWFTDVDAGATVVVDLDSSFDTFDPLLEIFGADGRLLAENDDRGDGTLNSSATAEVAASGPIQIRVQDLAHVSGGEYELTVAVAAG